MNARWIMPVIIAILLFIPSINASNWDADNHDLQNTSSTPDNGPEPPLKFLWNPKKLYIGGDWLTPIVHGNVVYLIRSDRNVADPWHLYPPDIWAVNITNGKVLWINNGTDRWNGATYAFYKSGMLLVDAPGIIESINSTTGEVIWKKIHKPLSKNFVLYKNKMYYLVSDFKNESSFIVCIDFKNGNSLAKIPVMENISGIGASRYLLTKNNILYIYNEYNKIIAVSLKNGSLIWKYEIKNPWVDLVHSPMIMSNGMIYVPFSTTDGGEIVALNATTGKVIWSRITDPKFDDFQYKFAYSAKYHMVVRLNGTGSLIAMDSRDGHILWITNSTYEGIATGTLDSAPVIANNYIYVYGSGVNSSMIGDVKGAILRIYNITTGKIVYQYIMSGRGWYSTSLDVPNIAVSDGKVFVPDGSLYVFVHNDASPTPVNTTLAYIGISAVTVSGIFAGVFIIRKKK